VAHSKLKPRNRILEHITVKLSHKKHGYDKFTAITNLLHFFGPKYSFYYIHGHIMNIFLRSRKVRNSRV
jgi:hypothetical protein